MKKTKKLCALLLSAAMAVGLLSGCGQEKEDVNVKADSNEVSSGQEPQAEEKEPEADGEPEVFTLKVHYKAAQGDWNDYWLIKTIEEKFNVDIQVDMISEEIWTEKVPLMFATEELPDFFLGTSLVADDVTQYGGEGYLLDLTDYISEEKTPNIWKMWQENPGSKAAVIETDGKIYGIVGAQNTPSSVSASRFYINYDWAEKILGKQPETLDEFYEYLKGVKEQDMNGNGDPTDEIPLGGCYSIYEVVNVLPAILNAFGFTQLTMEVIDGRVVYVPAEENYQHFLEFMNKIYTEGLLDPEFFSQTEEQANAKVANGVVGAYSDWAAWLNQPDETIWKQFDIMEPLTSEYNSEKMTASYDVSTTGGIYITKNCKNPEKLLEIADWLVTFEGYIAVTGGPELGTWAGHEDVGCTYELNEETGEFYMDYTYDTDQYASSNDWRQAEAGPIGYFPQYVTYDYRGNESRNHLLDGIMNHYAPYFHVGWPTTIKLTTEESDEVTLLDTDIESYKDEMVTKMIIGEVSIDEFDSFVEGLKERKLDRMLEIYQEAYDRWLANQ